jgi:hypothetical protein
MKASERWSRELDELLQFFFGKKPRPIYSLDPDPERKVEEDITDAPINVLHQIRTAVLCCNRTFEEQGISRIIVDYYKDHLFRDVGLRILRIGSTVREKPILMEQRRALAGEIVSYLELYRHMDKLIQVAIVALLLIKRNEDDFVCEILSRAIDIFMEPVRRQFYRLGLSFALLLSSSIFSSAAALTPIAPEEWSHRLVEQLLDAGLVDLLINVSNESMEDIEYVLRFTIFQGFLSYLRSRPTHQHYARIPILQQRMLVLYGHLQQDAADGLAQQDELAPVDVQDDEGGDDDDERDGV